MEVRAGDAQPCTHRSKGFLLTFAPSDFRQSSCVCMRALFCLRFT